MPHYSRCNALYGALYKDYPAYIMPFMGRSTGFYYFGYVSYTPAAIAGRCGAFCCVMRCRWGVVY